MIHGGRHLRDVECGMRGSVGFESVSFSLIVLLSSALAFHSKGIASSVCPDFVVTLTYNDVRRLTLIINMLLAVNHIHILRHNQFFPCAKGL